LPARAIYAVRSERRPDLDGRQNRLDELHLAAREDETHRIRHIWVIARGPVHKNAGTDLGLAAIPGIITASDRRRVNRRRIGSLLSGVLAINFLIS